MIVNAELNHRIRYQLMVLENARKEFALRMERLQDCKGSLLQRAKPRRKYYYYIKRRGSKRYCYVGDSSHKDVKRVKEYRFLKEAIRRVDRDISLLKAASDGYLPYDPSSVNENLPKIYRCEVSPVSELYEREGAIWKAAKLGFQKGFPENYPEHKQYDTTDGVKVKTLSEVTIYEMFKAAGLTFIYELPFPPADYGPALYPDFTVLSPVDRKTEIIVEFIGMLDRPDYRDGFAKRLGRYLASGYVLNVNLFLIAGDKNNHFDIAQVTKVIADIKGLTNTKAA